MTRGQKLKSKPKSKRPKRAPLILPELKAERNGRKLKITASHDGKTIHLDTIDFDSAHQRDRFLNGVCKRLASVDRAALEAKLLDLPNALPTEEPAHQPEPKPPESEPGKESPPVRVKTTFLPEGKKGTATAEGDGNAVYIDNGFDPLNPKHRKCFIKALTKEVPNLDVADAEKQLLDIAQQQYQRKAQQQAPPSSNGQPASQEKSTEELLKTMPKDIRDEALAMLEDSNLFERIVRDIAALGVAGEREAIATIYLVGVSRLLERPLSARVHGPSSSGKNHVIEQPAKLFPPETVIFATQMTPQALFHMPADGLVHKFIVAGERSRLENEDSAEATRALREMQSSGRLSKLMPVKEGGQIVTQLIEQEGPIAYVESTTLGKVFDEDANRCITLHTDERPEQTRLVIRHAAENYSQPNGNLAVERIIQVHHALQRMLNPKPVVIPFADRVGELMPADNVQVRRAFPQLMSMVQASAFLHQRQRKLDTDGRLYATCDDYQIARRLLLKPMMKQLGGGLSDPARRFWERLQEWASGTFTTTEAKRNERGSKSAVYGWLNELHEVGLLEQEQAGRGSAPAKWRLTQKSPDDAKATALPTMEAVFGETNGMPSDSTWHDGRKPQVVAGK